MHFVLSAVSAAFLRPLAPSPSSAYSVGDSSAHLRAVMRGGGGGGVSVGGAVGSPVAAQVDVWNWRDGTGKGTSFERLVAEAKRAHESRQQVEVHVGADSAVDRDRVTFAVVVCVVSVGHAGRYFYARREESLQTVPVLQTRLLREVELALDAAQELSEKGVDVVRVHIDSNTAPGCESSQHTKMLTGYVSAMGFRHLVKPEAWATFVADRHSRTNRHTPRPLPVPRSERGRAKKGRRDRPAARAR